MYMDYDTIEEYWRAEEYATPLDIIILSNQNESLDKFIRRRDVSLVLIIAFKHLNEEKTYT